MLRPVDFKWTSLVNWEAMLAMGLWAQWGLTSMLMMSRLGMPHSWERDGFATTTTGCFFIYFCSYSYYKIDLLIRYYFNSSYVLPIINLISFE